MMSPSLSSFGSVESERRAPCEKRRATPRYKGYSREWSSDGRVKKPFESFRGDPSVSAHPASAGAGADAAADAIADRLRASP